MNFSTFVMYWKVANVTTIVKATNRLFSYLQYPLKSNLHQQNLNAGNFWVFYLFLNQIKI
jgi:hypothetical protein